MSGCGEASGGAPVDARLPTSSSWTWQCQASLTPCAGGVLPPAEREDMTRMGSHAYCARTRGGTIRRWSYWEGMGRRMDFRVGASPTAYVIRTSSATEAASIL